MAGFKQEPTTPNPQRSNPMERITPVPTRATGPNIPSMPGINNGSSDFYKTYPAALNDTDKAALQKQLASIGAYNGIKKPWIQGFWNPAVDGAAFKKVVDLAVANGAIDPVTKYPDFKWIIDLAKADPKTYGTLFATSSTGGYKGPSTSINIQEVDYSAGKLKDTVNAAYQQAIGREATADEIAQAVQAVNKAYDKNPSKQVTTSSVNKKGQSVTQTTTSGGIDASQMIQDQAKASPEYGSYQSATTYFDAMLSALNGPVGRGF